MVIRRARQDESTLVADVWLRSRADSVPAVPAPVHTDDEVRAWFDEVVLPSRAVWVAEAGGTVVGVLVLGDGWIDQLHVAPEWTGRGVGSQLVDVAKELLPAGLDLWTFAANVGARRFYERHGFVAVASTDGDNEEGAPDVRYHWSPVDVRRMRPGELANVRALSVEAFGGDEHIGSLIDALRESWAWNDDMSFVAERAGEVVGHVLYTWALVDAPQRLVEVLVLSPVGVRPDVQGTGIGTALIGRSLREIEGAALAPLVFLEGSPGFYQRFGFEAAGGLGFGAPSDRIPPTSFQVRTMSSWEPWMRGRLVYPDAFWRTDSVGLRRQTELRSPER